MHRYLLAGEKNFLEGYMKLLFQTTAGKQAKAQGRFTTITIDKNYSLPKNTLLTQWLLIMLYIILSGR